MIAQIGDSLIGILMIMLPILLLTGIIRFVLNRQIDKKMLMKVMIVASLILLVTLQSGFIKSRKRVDVDWMIGKTLDTVRWRYSSPANSEKYQEPIIIDNRKYVFCTREIFEWDFIDGVLGETRYYVCFDESNLIKDVRFYDWGGMSPASDYSYMDRW